MKLLEVHYYLYQTFLLPPEGVKTEESDKKVTSDWSKKHLEIGIKSMTEIEKSGEKIKHFRY